MDTSFVPMSQAVADIISQIIIVEKNIILMKNLQQNFP